MGYNNRSPASFPAGCLDSISTLKDGSLPQADARREALPNKALHSGKTRSEQRRRASQINLHEHEIG